MIEQKKIDELKALIDEMPRVSLTQLPTPLHRLENFAAHIGGPELWIKRDDLSGLEGGGNKTRKLEFLVGDAIQSGADTLVTAGAIQSNHTRQTAAAAAKCNLKCALLHFAWTEDAGPHYRETGNILFSSLMGADLYLDSVPRPIEDQSPLINFVERMRLAGHKPYLVPAGASEHQLGSLGYMNCAIEIVEQSEKQDIAFDYVVHCTGSSSTQAGLVAGFAIMGAKTKVIGVSDDYETDIKRARVLQLANNSLEELNSSVRVSATDVDIIAADLSDYGKAETETFELIRSFASCEGLLADPVYEGKALRGLQKLVSEKRFEPQSRVLLMHLGGTPAIHGYANKFGAPTFQPST